MIEIQQGTPGSGKSAVAVARAISHLLDGGVVAANFSLVDGWADVVARQNLIARFRDDFRFKRASSLYHRFFRVDSLSAIKNIDPKSLAVGNQATSEGQYREGQGLLLLDEAQLIFNSRRWEKNFDWIEFFTQHRKLGWNVVLIAHMMEMIDTQIRPLIEYESRFRNLRNIKFPVIGVSMVPYPTFLVIRRYAGLGAGAGVVAGRNVYPLPLWAARLYDTCHVFSSEQWGRISDPTLCGPAPQIVEKVNVPRPRVSSLSGPHWDDYVMTAPPDDCYL